MEAKTPEEVFEKILPQRFNPEKAQGVDVTTQVNLTGSNGGSWIVIIKDQKISVVKGKIPEPTLALTMTSSDFLDVINKKLGVEKAFFSGRLHLEGNVSLALKLRDAGFL